MAPCLVENVWLTWTSLPKKIDQIRLVESDREKQDAQVVAVLKDCFYLGKGVETGTERLF